MADRYGGDHLDFRGGEFRGPFVAKGTIHQHAAAPTALDALPAKAAGFTGRRGELSQLLDAFDPSTAEAAEAVLVAAVSGLGGIGKTALAVEAAHAACAKGWFPGGVLFVDLHGYDDDPGTADQALEALLRALGTEPEHIPNGTDERAALYRSALVQRGRERGAVLVLADNASSAEQVRPLLPGGRQHRLLVTSRTRLPQLGARLVPLGELTPEEAYDLLDRTLRIADPSDGRVAREREAAAELASRCGHLPLAIQIAAALLVLEPDKPVAELAAELTESGDRLVHLDDGERSVRAAFDLSYRRLPPEQARLLRLLALAPGPEVTAEVVAALTGADSAPIRILNALSRAHLLERGSGRGRWRLHDLVRAFGASVVAGDAGLREEGDDARERLLRFYFRWALAAAERLDWLPGLPDPERFEDRAQALAWLDGERAGLVAAVQWAPEERYADTAVGLAHCLAHYLQWRRYVDDAITVARTAQEASYRAGNLGREGDAWNFLGLALDLAGRVEEAIDAFTRSRDLCRAAGTPATEAIAGTNLGNALRVAGRVEEAIEALTRARDLCRSVGEHRFEGKAWNNLGSALYVARRVEEAIDAFARARDLYRTAGDRLGVARTWDNLGIALLTSGRTEEAIEPFGKSLEIFREFEDWYGVGLALSRLAHTSAAVGDSVVARDHWLQSADAYTRAEALVEAAESRVRADGIPLTP